jgi:SAM-dependent methyltransferase
MTHPIPQPQTVRSHDAVVDDQFGPRAGDYVTSAVHASGEDLDALEAIVRRERPARALDLGAGGGHVAYRLAPHAGAVVAADLSGRMLAEVAAEARRRGLDNIVTEAAPAERLPFPDAAFDFLACRFSAHHWRDMEAGLREARRVLPLGATAVFVDAVSPGPAALDTHLQAVELLRDTSHVRDYDAGEWGAAMIRSGFLIKAQRSWRIRMDFPTWTARMATPDANCRMIRALQHAAAAEVQAHFAIEPDGSFMLDTLMIEATAA